MSVVEPCRIEDIPGVAQLHEKIFFNSDSPASQGLCRYYEDIFFHNPWRDEKYPSLVCRGENGSVQGFIGVIPRPMILNDRIIYAAVAHRLMVKPGESPFTAAKLVRTFLAGNQDLSISDGMNDAGKKIFQSTSGIFLLPYSMNWIKPIRPLCYVMSLAEKKQKRLGFKCLSTPVFRFFDCILKKHFSRSDFITHKEFQEVPVSEEMLLNLINEASKSKSLRPVYTLQSLKWLSNKLHTNKDRGDFQTFALQSENKKIIGACQYYMHQKKTCEVVQILSPSGMAEEIIKHLFCRAWDEGATCVFGRLDPDIIDVFWDTNCVMKRGCWTYVHSANNDIINLILRNKIFLTGLEAELWLYSPRTIL